MRGYGGECKGSPWENEYNESFNGKLRDEFLNREIFYTRRGEGVGGALALMKN